MYRSFSIRFFSVHIEVIKARQPERIGKNRAGAAPGLAEVARPGNCGPLQRTNETKLQRLHRDRKRRPLRFGHQQMNVLGHDHISEDDQSIAPAYTFKNLQE